MPSWFPTFRHLATRGTVPPSWWPLYTTEYQSRGLLRVIATALDESAPLVPLLERWQEDERGVQRRRLRRLVQLLKASRPLADAVEDVPGILRDEQALALRFDAQSGTRTAAMRRVLASGDPEGNRQWHRFQRTLAYLAIMLPIALFVFTFLNVKIVPVYVKMMQEFAMPPSDSLQQAISVGVVMARYWWLAVIAVFAAAWLTYSSAAGRLMRFSVLNRFFRPLRELHAAAVLQQLAVASSAGRPLAGALSTLARYYYAAAMRQKLLFVRNEVEQGMDAWQSMRDVGLLTAAEVRALMLAEQLGNRSWVLQTLADSKRQRTQWRLARLAEFVLPSVVVFLGLLVFLEALIVFQPLVQLLENLL